jgi:hypothetical protein
MNNTPSASLPDHYQQVLYWRLTGSRARLILIQALAIPLFILSGLFFFQIALHLGNLPSSFSIDLNQVGSTLAAILITIVLHEWLHGMTMKLFGAKPQYGFKWKQLLFYATCPGHAFQRNQYIAVALAPLVVLTIVFILGMWLLSGTGWVALLGICGVLNASGAIGDIWMSGIALRYPPTAYIVDEQDGMRVFLPDSNASETPSS